MAKGFFSQTIIVLFTQVPALDELKSQLDGFTVLHDVETGKQNPHVGERGLTILFQPEYNGQVLLDIIPFPWPDEMGHPEHDPVLFAAWGDGQYGPFTYPHNLARAIQQAWRWPEAPSEAQKHQACVRLRLSYALGKQLPAETTIDPLMELSFLTELAMAVSQHPAAQAIFNPAGETLLPLLEMAESLRYHHEHEIPPLELWSNVRFFNVDDTWMLMDSVGNAQLDIADVEVAFPNGHFNPADIDTFIRNISFYLLKHGSIIQPGDTMDDANGNTWEAQPFPESLSAPPRPIIRWFPHGQHPDRPRLLLPSQD